MTSDQGHPVPVPPHEYVLTLPHLTAYACLYVRDEDDHPVQLRSVYGIRPWQFPGGNQDAGEDPFQTARREAIEETGLTHWSPSPALLLVHYLHPEGQWPMPKVGFVFDGGQLAREQLAQIRLDPDEHSEWAAHPWDVWEQRMSRRGFARMKAVEDARRGAGPRLLVTGHATPA
ncbi:NUDIX hydrolase [Streptomyces sp. NBC_01601]|uniref:NUDIX hydrolase n=1 Tax=Streptomyces sp. NBC_01601 TaxID=2975892 RepID=UPI002E289F5F|nr:NUDIX hydrolase [Streptomyces sp. NBC_01601]